MKIVIKCATQINGVITKVGFTVDKGPKQELNKLVFIKDYKDESIETINGIKVHVIHNSYLRTVSDEKREDNLENINKC